MEISLKAYGKINLGLDVVRRREDGYHEVKMIMQTVDLWDELTFCDVTTDEIVITSDSSELPDVKDNIIYKACRMMKDIYGIDKGVHVTVDKHIPVAAGMAGGSADAAAALKAMNMLFGLNLSDEQLMEHGVKLGADVPYCIMQGTALSEGIGEILTPLPSMPDCLIVIAKPAIGVSTKWVYQNLKVDLLEEHPDIDGGCTQDRRSEGNNRQNGKCARDGYDTCKSCDRFSQEAHSGERLHGSAHEWQWADSVRNI